MIRATLLGMSAVVLLSSAAWAQAAEELTEEAAPTDATSTDEEASQEVAPPGAAPADASDASATSAGGGDGVRFRFGIAAGGGLLSAEDDFGNTASGEYFGLDLRFGAQINDLIGVYAVPQLGGYSLDVGELTGFGGLVGVSAVVDFTFIDRIFVGAGAGFGVLNNPSGAELHFRAGGYPIISRSSEKIRRKALMLGIDFRVHLVEGITALAPTFNVGYESF